MTGVRFDPAVFARILDPPASAQPASTQTGVAGPALHDPSVCGEFNIRIARDGTWFYHGSPITRKPLCRLFATVLRRDEDGDFWLVTPVERGRITVDDAPFTAVELSVVGAGDARRLVFRTNLDHEVTAGPAHPIRVVERPAEGSGALEPAPYILVRDRLEARILRPVFYQLVELAEERVVDGCKVLGVGCDGAFFTLGSPI
jgi:hypothetical protein